nr:stalk domain-containing protein [Deinobacterium chartae]
MGAQQLTVVVDQQTAYLNGASRTLTSPPRVVQGRTMLPLRETAALLSQNLVTLPGGFRLGELELYPSRRTVTLRGAAQDPDSSFANLEGQTFVSARLIADALRGTLSVAEGGKTLVLTVPSLPDVNPSLPQARFSTDKAVYAQGEPVIITEYSFDPLGADIVARRWTGRQSAYFKPGEYTLTLQAVNAHGQVSTPFSRTITVTEEVVATPRDYALRHAEVGESFPDPGLMAYPTATPVVSLPDATPLLFSDSPEVPNQSGVLYEDSVSGSARLLAYHINGLGRPARLHVMVRNLEAFPITVRMLRHGETAPTRVEGTLGQVTLLDYFASRAQPSLTLQPGESVAFYSSPVLPHGSGVNMMSDLEASGRAQVTFMFLEEGLLPSAALLTQLPVLPPDGRHVRGTFPGANRRLTVNVGGTLPLRLTVGDGLTDPALSGVDAITRQPVRLAGNYGVLYEIVLQGANGVVAALAPRGGLYKGAVLTTDLTKNRDSVVRLPASGVLTQPDQPAIFLRSASATQRLIFVPASGSNLPVQLVFYRPTEYRLIRR